MADVPSRLRSARPTLLERSAELAAADSALSDLTGATRGGVLAYAGSAGMGKTALLAELRQRAVARGCAVMSARGGERERETAFHVVRQLVQPMLAAADESRQRAMLGTWYDIVAPAVGLTADRTDNLPDPTGVRDGLDWLVTCFAVRGAPVVLILDDAHWADQESLDWLTAFAARAEELPMLIVLAYRPDELPRGRGTFDAVAGRQGARPHELAPLSTDAVARIVRHALGEDADDEFCREARAVTDGNPFEAVELAAKLHDRSLRGARCDITVLRDLASAVKGKGLAERLGRLTPSARRFAYAAAVLGTCVSRDLAASVAVVGAEDAVDAVEALREARILAEDNGPDGGLEFVHPLIATAVYRAIPSALRVGLHNAAADAVLLAGLGAKAAARHLLELPCEGDPRVVALLREAARESLRAGAPEAARRFLDRALQEPARPEDRAEVLFELGCSTFLTEPTATVTCLREALAEPGTGPRLRASITFRLAQALAHTGRLAEAAAVTAEEARRTTSPSIRLRMQAEQFAWSAFRTDEPDPRDRSRTLARLADRLTGRGPDERHILGLRAWDALVRGEPATTVLRYAEEALGDGLTWTDDDRGFQIPAAVAMTFMYCDQPALAEELFTRGIAECEQQGWCGSHLAFGYSQLGYIRYHRGFLPEAEELIRAGLRIADRLGRGVPAQWYAVGMLVQILIDRGRTEEARALADSYGFTGEVPGAVIYPDPRVVHAELLLAEGRAPDAERLLTQVGEWLAVRAWRNPSWCPWQLDLASAVCARDPERAVRTAQDAVKRARDFGAASAIGRALNTAAEVTGGPEGLALHAEAVRHLETSPAAQDLARALVGHGAALCRAGQPHEAADQLYRGLEAAVHCGADALAARAREELSAAGLRPLPLRYGQTDTLTAAERAAAELAVKGESASAIAHKMRITEQGVGRLLSAVYRKVGTDGAGLARALLTFPRPKP